MTLLSIRDLRVSVADTQIICGLDLHVQAGELHAIMGPNGSGKSTLTHALAGQNGYTIDTGSVHLDELDLTTLTPEARAHAGLFLALQYPVELPGVTNIEFLKSAVDSIRVARGLEELSPVDFLRDVRTLTQRLNLNPDFLKRGVNQGFSGGEKKRNEILQMLCLQPRVALLDETDSGLDIDALQTVAKGIEQFRSTDNAIVLVTHYQRLLNYLVPDQVHILVDGKIVKSGDASLAIELEEKGYGWLENHATTIDS